MPALRFGLGLIVATGALLLIALTGGGWLALDRLDPLLAVPGAGLAAMLGAAVAGQMSWRVALLWGALATVAMATAAVAPPHFVLPPRAQADDLAFAGPPIIFAVAVALIGVSLLRLLQRGRRMAVLAFTVAFAVLWQSWSWSWIVPLYDHPQTNRSVLLVSGLPLIDPTGRTAPAAVIGRLRAASRLIVSDHVSQAGLVRTDVLVLAHPRALPPEELVAIDQWVRRGGDAVIFADGLSAWPTNRPLGDPSNPPLTSLLTPLLTHWGIRLDAPDGMRVRQLQFGSSASRLTMIAPGRFVAGDVYTDGGQCHIFADGVQGWCAIGQGTVQLFSDADMLQEALWQGPPRSHRGASIISDNVDRLLDFIGRHERGPLRRPIWWHCGGCPPLEVIP